MPDSDSDILLDVSGLQTHFFTDDGVVKAVDGVDLTVRQGEMLCVVGESGCGKSVTARSILQIVGEPGRVVGGTMNFSPDGDGDPVDLAQLDPKGSKIRSIRGNDIAMIFQEPMTSLSPVGATSSSAASKSAIRIAVRPSRRTARSNAASARTVRSANT